MSNDLYILFLPNVPCCWVLQILSPAHLRVQPTTASSSQPQPPSPQLRLPTLRLVENPTRPSAATPPVPMYVGRLWASW